jgi:divalent metal cation (Fe/Co/Zn/Cd) transporter
MEPLVKIEVLTSTVRILPANQRRRVLWLQGITITWMLIECVISLYGAATAHSAALFAFGSDSLVELLSASVVILAISSIRLTKEHASYWAGLLLFVLAGIVGLTATVSLIRGVVPETSCAGIGITAAALIVMPILAWFKRRTARDTNDRALAADAVQSATCAYLAALTLIGLTLNAAFHIRWVDSVAALAALPILVIEGRCAVRGDACGCCP